MSKDDQMPFAMEPEKMWRLSGDGRTVRLQLPPLPITGLPEPLRVHLDFDAEALDEMLERLAILRAQMMQPLSAARN